MLPEIYLMRKRGSTGILVRVVIRGYFAAALSRATIVASRWGGRRECKQESGWNFRIFVWGFCKPPKNCVPRSSILGGVLVIRVQLKQHNFERYKAFWGLVDIQRMYFLYMGFDGGCTVWVLWPPEDVHFIVNTTPCSLISGSKKILCKSGFWMSRLSK